MSKLKNGRLIPAGVACPWTGGCPFAKSCNRPGAMANDFSCATARAFDMLERTGGKGNMAQHRSVMDTNIEPSNNQRPKDIEDILNEKVPDEIKKPLLDTTNMKKGKRRPNGSVGRRSRAKKKG